MTCGGSKEYPRTSSMVHLFFSFEICEGILRNQTIMIGLDKFRFIFLSRFNRFAPIWITLVIVSTTLLNLTN